MFLHANSQTASDGDLSGFLRLGTDTEQNYYEIEIPLKISDPSNTTDAREVWPEENEIDLDLNALLAMKLRRDNDPSASIGSLYTFPEKIGNHTIRIFGRPDLSSVQVMMIGVRNNRSDDHRVHSACIWANELRVTEFNRAAGYALSTTVNTKLADFATLTGALRYTTFGFGSVSSKIGERTRDETTAYDVSANVNVDKLIPGNTGIKVPMFVSYENTTINPQFDPANPDTKIEAALLSYENSEERQDFIKLIQDKTIRRSLNFVNVRKTKVKQDAPTHIYDIENLAFSYSYSEGNQTNFFIQEALQRQYRASVAYNFAPKATGIEPFKNAKGLSSPYLRFIKDFNISLLPSSISVRGDLDRSFSRRVYRNASDNGVYFLSDPIHLKTFMFNRNYNMRWALSKSLTFEYTAQANSVIDEPQGDIDTEAKKDSIIHNLKQLGRMKNFNQTVTVNYTLPLDKFPITDWLSAEYRYQAGYNWVAGPINILHDTTAFNRGVEDMADSLDFKNTIQNNRENNITGKIDLVKLYNKVKFLKNLNSPPKPQLSSRPQPGRPTSSRNAAPKADTVKSLPPLVKGFFRLLMSVRSINGTYTRNEGTILRGFDDTPKYFGMSEDWNAPEWQFIVGGQDPLYKNRAAAQGKIVKNRNLTNPFVQTRDESLTIRANVEPSPDMKIQIDVKKETNTAYQEIFRYDTIPNGNLGNEDFGFVSLNPGRSGSYKISFLSINTAFNSSNDDIKSEVFNKFEENLAIMQDRFRTANSLEFDSTNQDVVIPAFIAAYSGKSAYGASLSPFPSTPLPNWRIDYSGLSKLGALKEIFQSVTISHGYQSSYSVMNYSNSLEFTDPDNVVRINKPIEDYNKTYFGRPDLNGEYEPIYVISQVMISEQFAPLIGINVRTKSRLTARAEYKTKRDVVLNISNAQVSEVNNKDVSFELGYTKNNMKLPFKSQGRTIVLKNDVTFRVNMTITNGKTIQRTVNEPAHITNGNINYQLRPNISYVVNQKLTLQAYFERTINEPVVTTSYKRSTTRFGLQVRFSLAQ
jgi:cell surface protein SprA